ncbi:MAG: ATP-binding protein [Fibrobacterales bacterium]
MIQDNTVNDTSQNAEYIQKKLILNTKMSLSFVALLVILSATFLVSGYQTLGLLLIPFMAIFIAITLLSKMGFTKAARQGFVISSNITVLVFSILVGKESAIELLFIILIMFPFQLFTVKEKYQQIFSIIMLLSCAACTQLFHVFSPSEGITPAVARIIEFIIYFYVFFTVIALNASEYFVTTSRSEKLKASNKELGNYKDKLEEMVVERTKALEEANRSKSEFLASMSNEIISPINEIISYNKLLSGSIQPELRSHVSAIEKSSQDLLVLINDIIDVSKLETGWIKLNQNPLDLKLILNEIKETYFARCENKQVAFEVNIASNFPHRIILDELRLRQIITNFVSNSVKFTPSGSITIDVTFDYIDEELISFDVQVSDTGKGMSENKLQHLFDTFRVSNIKDSVKYKGTGLGLSICEKLTRMMGGHIKVKSQLNKGTTFTIHFADIAISALHAISTEGFKEVSDIEFDGQTILTVDDVAFNREVVKKILMNHNLKVITAENGSEATLIAQKIIPDLIIMDIRMPIMNGYQAAEIIKTGVDTKQIPIIALTASTSSENIDDDDNNFFDGVLPKPIKAPLLLGELSKHLHVDGTKK